MATVSPLIPVPELAGPGGGAGADVDGGIAAGGLDGAAEDGAEEAGAAGGEPAAPGVER
jgi:hypothetical protein